MELESDSILRKPVEEALEILRQKYKLLSEADNLALHKYDKDRKIYLYTVKHFKQQVRELVHVSNPLSNEFLF